MKSIALAAASFAAFLTASSAFAQISPLNRPPSSGPLPSDLPPSADTLPDLPNTPEPAPAAKVDPEDPEAATAITELPLAEKPTAPPPHFGQRGQVVISSAMSLGVSSSAYSNSEASSLRVTFDPAIDVFVDENVSIGLDVDIGYSDQKGYAGGSLVETTSTSYGAGVRVAYNIPLGTSFSLWTRATLGYSAAKDSEPAVNGTPAFDLKSEGAWLNLYAPLLVHPAPHYFLGVGPGVHHDLGRRVEGAKTSNDRTTIYASFVVGGYF
jgi:opacity protein-like surface antigen